MIGSSIHIHQSPFIYDRRILRETESIVRAGWVDFVHLAGLGAASVPQHQMLDSRRSVWRVQVRAHPFLWVPPVRGVARARLEVARQELTA